MKRFIRPTAAAFAVIGMAGFSLQAQAVTTGVGGSMGKVAHTCLQGLVTSVGDGENCMYDGGPVAPSLVGATPFGETTGPYEHIAYYDYDVTPGAYAASYARTVGDGKINQVLGGSVDIDDGGDGFGANDTIAFTLTFTSPSGGKIVRNIGSAGADRYTSMTQVLAPTVADSVAPNVSGGFDYVIGSEGFPSLLTFAVAGSCLGVPFGNVECGHSFAAGGPPDPDFWAGTTTAGLGSLEGNSGAKTVGTVTDLECTGSGTTCTGGGVSFNPLLLGAGNAATGGGYTAEDVGWDNLLLLVSTNADGNVLMLAGFDVQDYRVFGTTRCGDQVVGGLSPEPFSGVPTGSLSDACNSWSSSFFMAQGEFAPIPLPAGAWLIAPAVLAAGRFARRRKAA